MFPIRDENPTFNTSIATFLIIGLNAVSWLLLQGAGFQPWLARSICKFGLIPGELLGLAQVGTQIPLSHNIACVIDGQANWLTVITSMFMHGGWFHIIGNMWFLAIFGDNVEDVMGSVRFVVFYLLCGIGAVAAQMLANPASAMPMVGASGAIGGIMGAYALLFPRAPVHKIIFFGFFFTRTVVPAFLMLGYWFLLQFLGGFLTVGNASGGVAFWAHIGGFASGIILVRMFCSKNRLADCRTKRGRVDQMFQRFIKERDTTI